MDAAREGEEKEKGPYKIPSLFKKAGWDLCHGLSWQRFGGWMGLTPLNGSVFGQKETRCVYSRSLTLKVYFVCPHHCFYSGIPLRHLLSCLRFYVLNFSFLCHFLYLWLHLSIVHAHHFILLSLGEKCLLACWFSLPHAVSQDKSVKGPSAFQPLLSSG